MKKLLCITLIILTGAAFAAGCSDEEDNGVEDVENVGPSIERGAFVHELAGVICARVYNCCSNDELESVLRGVGASNEEECRTNQAALLEYDYKELMASTNAGSITYDAGEAGACLHALSTMACAEGILGDDADDYSDLCNSAFAGNISEGDACRNNSECNTGACVGIEYDASFEITVLGSCQPVRQPGEVCGSGHECAEGSRCDFESSPDSGLQTGTCQKYRQIGESCDHGDCVEGAYCVVEANPEFGESTGVCAAQKAAGEACVSLSECLSWSCDWLDGNPETQQTVCIIDTIDDQSMCDGN